MNGIDRQNQPSSSRVERRVVFAFLLFTLVPLTVLGYLGVREIERQALQRAQTHLDATTASYADALLDQLGTLETQLRIMLEMRPDVRVWATQLPQVEDVQISAEAQISAHVTDPGKLSAIAFDLGAFWLGIPAGQNRVWFQLDLERIRRGLGESRHGGRTCVYMGDIEYHCGIEDVAESELLTATARLRLEENYQVDFTLNVQSVQPRDVALSSLRLLSVVVPLSIALVCMIATLVAMRFVRHWLKPLSALQAATRKIEIGDYSHRVKVESRDEFESLARSFNQMAEQLEGSFQTMTTLADIDRMILSASEPDAIVASILSSCAVEGVKVGAVLWRRHEDGAYWSYALVDEELVTTELPDIPEFEGSIGEIDELLNALRDAGQEFDHWLPLYIEKQLSGVFVIRAGTETLAPDLLKRLSDLGDRLSVAITNLDRADALYRQANFDPLTGLINRYAFEDRLTHALLQAQRDAVRGALLFIDLDRFKQVNDTEGHKAGDKLLKKMAGRLYDCLRASDTLARLGGDEFAIIVHRFEDESEIAALCRRLVTEIGKPVLVDRIEHSVNASIGVSVFPGEGTSVEQLLMRADAAMYRAKEMGGGTFAFFDQQLNETTRQRVKLESALRKALREGDLEVYFQPKLHLATGVIDSCEALLRWDHAELGFVGPNRFIPIAEETGLIHEIGPMVVRSAVAAIEHMKNKGVDVRRIAVNVSTKEILAGDYARRFLDTLGSHGGSPEFFEVEVTESLFIHDTPLVVDELNALREAGVIIALDDFGTGFSSLNLLRNLPLDIIKIDRSFVVAIGDSKTSRELTKNIIQIACALDKVVVAEGAETRQQIALLREYGCDFIQGYGVSKALPLDAYIEFMIGYRKAREERAVRRSEA
jgi:diguanylate cyclase (GGDEF)-like protein